MTRSSERLRRFRHLGFAVASLAIPQGAGAAPVRLAESAIAYSLTVAGRLAVVAVDSGDRDDPFTLVRTSGRGRNVAGRFGGRNAEFPNLATTPGGRAWVTWGVPVSGGARVHVAPVDDVTDTLPEVVATGPSWMAFRGGSALLAYPDEDGNATLATLPLSGESRTRKPEPRALSSNAPLRRHLPLGVAVSDDGPLVLDLVQQRDRTELRVLGEGAPSAAILSIPLLRHVPARLAVDGDRIAVGYERSGSAYVATARLGGSWSRRRLPGSGGEGAPAPVFVDGSLRVLYTRRVAGQRDVYSWSGGRLTRVTATPGDEREVLAAASGRVAYAAWTRREKTGAKSAFVARLP